MRFIKPAILSLVILFLLVTGISLLIPSHVRISKAINMKTMPDSVWKEVDDLHRWERWNPFFSELSSKKISWLDTIPGKWNSIKVENTTIAWKEKNQEEHIAELLSNNRQPMVIGWKCIPHLHTDSLTLQWYIDFRLRWYPWEKFASLLFEKSYGTKMEQGLANLKTLLEK